MFLEDFMKAHGVDTPEDLCERTGIDRFWMRGFWHGTFGFYGKGLAKSTQLQKIANAIDEPIDLIIDHWYETRWTGWVYLFQQANRYKIGRSWDPKRRYRSLLHKYPGLTYLHEIWSNNIRHLELSLHHQYEPYGTGKDGREWFLLPLPVVHMLCQITTFTYKAAPGAWRTEPTKQRKSLEARNFTLEP